MTINEAIKYLQEIGFIIVEKEGNYFYCSADRESLYATETEVKDLARSKWIENQGVSRR